MDRWSARPIFKTLYMSRKKQCHPAPVLLCRGSGLRCCGSGLEGCGRKVVVFYFTGFGLGFRDRGYLGFLSVHRCRVSNQQFEAQSSKMSMSGWYCDICSCNMMFT